MITAIKRRFINDNYGCTPERRVDRPADIMSARRDKLLRIYGIRPGRIFRRFMHRKIKTEVKGPGHGG